MSVTNRLVVKRVACVAVVIPVALSQMAKGQPWGAPRSKGNGKQWNG